MALRLKTFWWSFGMSVVGFVIAIISLIVALANGEVPHTVAVIAPDRAESARFRIRHHL